MTTIRPTSVMTRLMQRRKEITVTTQGLNYGDSYVSWTFGECIHKLDIDFGHGPELWCLDGDHIFDAQRFVAELRRNIAGIVQDKSDTDRGGPP